MFTIEHLLILNGDILLLTSLFEESFVFHIDVYTEQSLVFDLAILRDKKYIFLGYEMLDNVGDLLGRLLGLFQTCLPALFKLEHLDQTVDDISLAHGLHTTAFHLFHS